MRSTREMNRRVRNFFMSYSRRNEAAEEINDLISQQMGTVKGLYDDILQCTENRRGWMKQFTESIRQFHQHFQQVMHSQAVAPARNEDIGNARTHFHRYDVLATSASSHTSNQVLPVNSPPLRRKRPRDSEQFLFKKNELAAIIPQARSEPFWLAFLKEDIPEDYPSKVLCQFVEPLPRSMTRYKRGNVQYLPVRSLLCSVYHRVENDNTVRIREGDYFDLRARVGEKRQENDARRQHQQLEKESYPWI
eukprot:gb/GECG01011008.1/.p1 GENE.gb/GECG01011008.1/~~gb/GECG01011008.1/.p1  ORF type:complete len:249 (+),score=23.46 gb/GECG01011008.1/:1-747(+)